MNPCTVILIVFLSGLSTTSAVVTNEDIRIAILQMVNLIRSTDDKLERLEIRERVVGEQLKKGMINIDKKIKMLDPLKGTVGRLDERLAAVETILMQKNEREKMQLQRTYEAVIDIQKNLPVIMEEMKNDIIAKITSQDPPAQFIEPVISKKDFEMLEKAVGDKIEKVTAGINNLENGLVKMKDDTKQVKDLNIKSSNNLENLKQHINDNKQLLTKYDKKLAEYNNKIPETTNKNSKEQEEWKQNILKALDGQKSNFKDILLDLRNLQNKLDHLPQTELIASQRTILNKLENLTRDISSSAKRENTSTDNIRRAIQDISASLSDVKEDTMKNINGLTEITAVMMKTVASSNNALAEKKAEVDDILQTVRNLRIKVDQLPQKDDLSDVQHATLKKIGELSNQQNPPIEEMRRTMNDLKNNLDKSNIDTKKRLGDVSAIAGDLARKLDAHLGANSNNPEVREILTDVRILQNQVNQLPQKYDLSVVQNATLQKLGELSNDITSSPDRTVPILQEIKNTLNNVNDNVNKTEDNIMRNLNDLSEITGTLAGSFAKNYGKISTEIQALNKIDQVMIKTADDVIDTKRLVEYGVHQVLGELAKQLKETSKSINQGLNDRIDQFEATILDGETGALANVTAKIDNDIQQVWRQIGIMYQQISTSSDTLNHLQNLTDSYVNGSLGAMDNMKGKVGQITGRITEVDENLNYLLGRLSLVTQEFSQIKTGLSSALSQIRDNFHAVQDQIKDSGPGPHQIASNEVVPNN